MDISGVNLPKALDRFRKAFAGGVVDEQDGLRIDFPKYWIQLRKSNTEPIARIIAEAPTKKEVEALCKKAAALLK